MGEHNVPERVSEIERRAFMRAVLDDLTAMDEMIRRGMIESGIRRIGAEQEMFLVDKARHPASVAMELLAGVDDDRLTTELARFNLEANTSPRVFGGSCLSELEKELDGVMRYVRGAAHEHDADVVLCGILPTLEQSDLSLEKMCPIPRYHALNNALTRMRGGSFRVDIKGLDELEFVHDNVMLEACNTSFQIHFQVGADEFAPLYNLAQAVTGPVLAAAANSPTLLGHRLWHETRVALFQQSIDVRSSAHMRRGARPRVTFGEDWVKESVLEIFREDIARFRVVLACNPDEDPIESLYNGEPPPLSALRLHNGTVYRWNRPCYGVHDGVAHLRVENRVLPSGPTVVDEVANAAFFYGLMSALSEEHGQIDKHLAFDDAKANFFAAARHGLQAQFNWIRGKTYTASQLILEHLLPQARAGLEEQEIDRDDIDRYLGIIENRVKTGRTGAQWMNVSLAGMSGRGVSRDARMRTVTNAMIRRQEQGDPVHTWPLARAGEQKDWRDSFRVVAQVMTREVLTISPHDIVDLAASVMEWEGIRHMPVEDDEGKLVGILSHNDVLRMVGRGMVSMERSEGMPVRGIMTTEVITCTPTTTTLDAMRTMREKGVRCLPVIEEGRVVGIVTEADFLDVASALMEMELERKENGKAEDALDETHAGADSES